MATYTIEINESTHSGRALIAYLKELGILVEKIVTKTFGTFSFGIGMFLKEWKD